MITRATLPITLWGYALEFSANILNLVPTKKVGKTPSEPPSLAHLKFWGCKVFLHRKANDKLEPRS